MSPALVTIDVTDVVTGGKGNRSGLMTLAMQSLSSVVRNPLVVSTKAEKRVFLPSTLPGAIHCLTSPVEEVVLLAHSIRVHPNI